MWTAVRGWIELDDEQHLEVDEMIGDPTHGLVRGVRAASARDTSRHHRQNQRPGKPWSEARQRSSALTSAAGASADPAVRTGPIRSHLEAVVGA